LFLALNGTADNFPYWSHELQRALYAELNCETLPGNWITGPAVNVAKIPPLSPVHESQPNPVIQDRIWKPTKTPKTPKSRKPRTYREHRLCSLPYLIPRPSIRPPSRENFDHAFEISCSIPSLEKAVLRASVWDKRLTRNNLLRQSFLHAWRTGRSEDDVVRASWHIC